MNRFRSKATPVKGLTADILVSTDWWRTLSRGTDRHHNPQIMAAEIAYDRGPSYARYAPDQASDFMQTAIEWTMDDAKRNGGWITGSRLAEHTAPAQVNLFRREQEDTFANGGWTPDMGATPRGGTPTPAFPV